MVQNDGSRGEMTAEWMIVTALLLSGFAPGALIAALAIAKVRVYSQLWENERAGNYIMTKRLTELESSAKGE